MCKSMGHQCCEHVHANYKLVLKLCCNGSHKSKLTSDHLCAVHWDSLNKQRITWHTYAIISGSFYTWLLVFLYGTVPASISVLIFRPRGEPEDISARNISPVDRWHTQYLFLSSGAWKHNWLQNRFLNNMCNKHYIQITWLNLPAFLFRNQVVLEERHLFL